MAQNVYDDEGFFAAYARLPRSVEGLAGAAEWPSLRALLPSLAGRSVLDLGCGYGWFSRWAIEQGATAVVGVDLSERMLARARSQGDAEGRIAYLRADLDTVELPTGAFDLAFSSLTLHYVVELARLLGRVGDALVPGAAFVASVEHPVYTAPSQPAFVAGPGGTRVWPLDGYLDEGPRTTNWLAPGVVKQHRTIGTYLAVLRAAGFRVADLVEYGPSAEELAARPEWAGERDRPLILLLAARRD